MKSYSERFKWFKIQTWNSKLFRNCYTAKIPGPDKIEPFASGWRKNWSRRFHYIKKRFGSKFHPRSKHFFWKFFKFSIFPSRNNFQNFVLGTAHFLFASYTDGMGNVVGTEGVQCCTTPAVPSTCAPLSETNSENCVPINTSGENALGKGIYHATLTVSWRKQNYVKFYKHNFQVITPRDANFRVDSCQRRFLVAFDKNILFRNREFNVSSSEIQK